MLKAEVLATRIMRPPSAANPERNVPLESNISTRFPVWLAPAVISTPASVEAEVVSIVKIELPEPSWISTAEVEAKFCTNAPNLFIVNNAAPVELETLNKSSVLAAGCIERRAVGEEVPIPSHPAVVKVEVAVAPNHA